MGDFGWKGWMQLIIGLGLTYLFFYMMAPFIVPIILGSITSLLCYPAYSRLRRSIPRWLAALAVTLGVTLGGLLPLVFVLINGSQQLLAWIARIRMPKAGGPDALLNHPVIHKFIASISRFTPIDQDWLRDQSLSVLQSVFETVSHAVATFLAGMPVLLLDSFIVIISVYFLLVDGTRLLKFLSTLSPIGSERSHELYSTFENSCRGVVLGLFASAGTQGALIAFLFAVTGIPNAALMGIVGVVMGMIPVIGTAPITLGAVIYLFGIGSQGAGIVMIVGFVVVATVDNVIRSLILKGQSEMHPLLALVSAFGATNLMGPPGIFLGPIIAAIFVSFLRILSLELRRESVRSHSPVDHPR